MRAEAAKLDTLRASAIIAGTVLPSPGADWTITAPDRGKVAEILKAEGDVVKVGDVLVKFEVPELTAELLARQLELAQATTRLQAAKANDTRLAGLLARGIATQRDADEAQRERMSAEAAVREAQSAKDAADVLASRVVVKARFDGVVAQRWHNAGDQVEAGAADPVLRVIDPTRLEVVAAVPTTQLSLVTPGLEVKIQNPTDGTFFNGTVITAPLALDPSAPTGDVRIAIPKTTTLPASTPVTMEIQGEERRNVVVVASAAIMRDGGETFVMVAGSDGKAHHKTVTVGLIVRDRTQITSGLTAGELVILAGPEPVPDGAAVTVQK